MATTAYAPEVAPPPERHQPWYRKPVAWIAAVVLVAGLVLGLVFGLSGGGPASPVDILHRDGYQTIMTVAKSDLANMAGNTAVTPFVVAAAAGYNGTTVEVVMQLTDSGAQLVKGQWSDATSRLPSGVTAHMDGDDLILSGPADSFG